MVGIYKITNKNTGEIYIGQSINCERRIDEHKQKRSQTIDNYINVLGPECFNFEIIEECNIQELDQKEKENILQFDSINKGYNQQFGGFNNSIGSGNGRAKISEKDVAIIRKAYANHESPKEVYELLKDSGLTYKSFQSVWQGKSWSHIMPEVFTTKNKKYYTHSQYLEKASLKQDEVIKYRTYYITHTFEETYKQFIQDKGIEFLKKRTFQKILVGDVRKESSYKAIPVYKKQLKRWELNGQPVSTISGSGEYWDY